MRSGSARRILVLDFGAHAIKVGEFQRSGDSKLTLLNYGVKALDHHDPRDRFSCLVKTLKSLFEETRAHRGPVLVGISEAFMRFVTLPANLEGHSIRKIMEFEAKQNIPSPLEDVIWDYQILSDGKEREAVIVAVKKDFLEEIQAALAHLKMDVAGVEVTPWALAEAYRYNYPDSKGCALLIDIGEKTTHLVFTENGKIFCRSLPVAGHLITKNIANELEKSYPEAEELKKKNNSLAKAAENGSDQNGGQVAKIVKSVFSQLHVEVSQSIRAYQEQYQGTPPKTVFISGGTSLTKDAETFLRKKLSLPVEYLNPFKRIAVTSLLNQSRAAKDAVFLAPLAGMALEERPNFELRPASSLQKAQEKIRRPWLMGALVAWVAVFLVPLTAQVAMYKKASKELEERRVVLAQTEALWKEIQSKEKKFAKNAKILELCEVFSKQRSFWSELFNELDSCIPDDVWLTSLKLEKDVLKMRGFVEAGPNAMNQVSVFKKALEDGVVFGNVESKQAELNLNPQGGENASVVLGFELEGTLKKERTPSP